jgi:lysophospholipase L1-like esterase
LELSVPRRLAPGAVGRIRVIDRWGNGGVTAQLCVTPPGASRTCGDERLRRAISVATRRFRATTSGRWRVELRFRGHRVRRSIAVGAGVGSTAPPPTVLTTGDSTMQGIDSFLADELGDSAKVRSDVRPGTGISKPLGPWATLARTQTEHLRQAATVVSLGVADGFPLRARDGTRQECCGAAWTAEYTRRVRVMMRTYRRHGRARVLWLTLPIPKGPRAVTDAVNRSVVQAAEGLAGVSVLRMDLFFTPDGFRDVMPYRGRSVDVREEDGIHLNITGTAIAAKIVAAVLRKR